eukprot:9495960-Karenia_brevis.AAC.1
MPAPSPAPSPDSTADKPEGTAEQPSAPDYIGPKAEVTIGDRDQLPGEPTLMYHAPLVTNKEGEQEVGVEPKAEAS